MKGGFAWSRSTPQSKSEKGDTVGVYFDKLCVLVVRCSEPTHNLRELSHSSAESQPETAPDARSLLRSGNKQIAMQAGPDQARRVKSG